jgi:hypothetical protein
MHCAAEHVPIYYFETLTYATGINKSLTVMWKATATLAKPTVQLDNDDEDWTGYLS